MNHNDNREVELIELGVASDVTHGIGVNLTDSPAGLPQTGILED
jgi:hypothetical protein